MINPEFQLIIHVGRQRVVIDVTNGIHVDTGIVKFRAAIPNPSQRLRGLWGYGQSADEAVFELINKIAKCKGIRI